MSKPDEGQGQPVEAQGSRRPLVLKNEDFKKNTAALFDELARDEGARRRFIENPMGQVAEKILGRDLGPQHESDANRILFSMLANDQFREWLVTYSSKPKKAEDRLQQFKKDFATALIEHGDQNIILGLLKNASDGFDLPGFAQNDSQLLINSGSIAAVPVATPSTSDQTAHSSSNANAVAFGDVEVVDPALMRSIVEQVIAHAQELSARGELGASSSELR